jgi:hypothetical protein
MAAEGRMTVTQQQVAAAQLLVQLDRKLGRKPDAGLIRIAFALSEEEVLAGRSDEQEGLIVAELARIPERSRQEPVLAPTRVPEKAPTLNPSGPTLDERPGIDRRQERDHGLEM